MEKTLKRVERAALFLQKNKIRAAVFEARFPYKEIFSMYGVSEYHSREFEQEMLLKIIRRMCIYNGQPRNGVVFALFDQNLSFSDSKFLAELLKAVKNLYLITDNKEKAEILTNEIYDESGMPLLISEDGKILKSADVVLICSEGGARFKNRVGRKAVVFDIVSKNKVDFNAAAVIAYLDVPLPEWAGALFGPGIKSFDAASILFGLCGRRELLDVPEQEVMKSQKLLKTYCE